MATIGNLVVNLLGNAAPLQQTLNQTTSMLDGFKSRVLGTLAGVGAAFSVSKAVEAARSQVEAESRLGAVLKATGGAARVTSQEVVNLASELQNLTAVSDDATIGAAAQLATFENITGENFKETLRLAQDLSVLMKTDMTSATAMLGKALVDPVEGFAKLKKAGVVLTESQKKNIASLQNSGDMGGAQAALLQAARSKVGGVAEAAADPIKKLMGTLGDVLETIGFLLLPSIAKLADGFRQLFQPLADSADNAKGTGKAIADAIGPAIDAFLYLASIVRDVIKVSLEVPDTVRAMAFALGALAVAIGVTTVAYKAAVLVKAMFIALSGPKGLVAIAAATIAVAGIGMAMDELHGKYVTSNADKKEEITASKKAAEAIKEEAEAVRKLAEERKKSNLAEAKRLTEVVQDMGFGIGAGGDKRSKLIRDFERFNNFKNDRKLFPDLPDSVRAMDLDPSRNKKIADAIENSISGIVDAIKDAQIETKILNKEMTEIDRTIASFADKKADVGKREELRKILEINKAIKNENDMLERSKSIIKDLQTPLEQLKEKFDEIGYLQGLGMLDDIQAEAARAKAANELMPQGGDSQYGAVGAAESGSQAAFGAIQAAIRSGSRDEVPKQQLDIAKKQLAELEESNKLRREQAQAPVGLPVGIN
jgi:hypothetical protein